MPLCESTYMRIYKGKWEMKATMYRGKRIAFISQKRNIRTQHTHTHEKMREIIFLLILSFLNKKNDNRGAASLLGTNQLRELDNDQKKRRYSVSAGIFFLRSLGLPVSFSYSLARSLARILSPCLALRNMLMMLFLLR